MIYVCYGAKKSGSTLTYKLTQALLTSAGHPHIPLSADDRHDSSGHGETTNTIRLWSAEVVDTALSKVPAQHVVAFRTHHEPSKNIAAAIEKGQAKVQICVRDPRDLALSMWDVLKQQRAKGRDRPHLTSLTGMLEHIERNLRYTHKWADLGTPLILNYEQTAFSPEVSLSAISNDVGLIVDSSSFGTIFNQVTSTKNAAQNRNVAKPYRHRREMELSVQEVFLERFQAYYERFLPGSTAVSEAVLKNAAVG